jgi:predicted O-methyltransferase YrrM
MKKEMRRFADRILNLAQDFRFNQIGDKEQLFLNIPHVRFRHNVEGVMGWLRPNERNALYALARWLPGPFLEVGPWAGLSTLVIANGIKDSKKEKFFVTYELNPKSENYRPVENGVGFFYLAGSDRPFGCLFAGAF